MVPDKAANPPDPASTRAPQHQSPARWVLPLLCLVVVGGAVVGFLAWSRIPRDPQLLYEEALKLADRDPPRSERLLKQSIKVAGGRFAKSEAALCRLLVQRGDWNGAVALYTSLNPADLEDSLLVEFGILAYQNQHVAEAQAALNEVRRRRTPESIRALDLLFVIHRERQEETQMLDCVREMALLEPNRPELWWKLLELLDDRQLDNEWIEAVRLALEQELPERDAHELRHKLVARLVDPMGNAVEARRELEKLLEKEGTSPRAKLHMAAIYRLEGKPAEALKSLEKAIKGIGDQPGVVRLRAMIYLDLGKFREAARDFEAEVADNPFNLTAHVKLAEAYRSLGETDQAQQHEATALEIRERRQRINKLLAEYKKQPPEKRTANRKICEGLAELYRELNDLQNALLWEKRASQADRQ